MHDHDGNDQNGAQRVRFFQYQAGSGRLSKKWQAVLVKLGPVLIWSKIDEQRSASWYSFEHWLLLGGTGSV